MSTARITVSMPTEVRQAALSVAQAEGVPLSSVVSEAVIALLRTRLVDSWLVEFQQRSGPFDEEQLEALAKENGVPYLPPRPRSSAA